MGSVNGKTGSILADNEAVKNPLMRFLTVMIALATLSGCISNLASRAGIQDGASREPSRSPPIGKDGGEPYDEPLKVSFMKPGYRLVLAAPEGVVLGLPTEAFVRPHLVGPGTRKLLNHLDDLTGYVDLATDQKMVDFARLWTSPKTAGYFGTRTMEVVSYTKVDLDWWLGDAMGNIDVKHPSDGWDGMVVRSDARTLADSYPKLERQGEDTIITRLVVRKQFNNTPQESFTVLLIKEAVRRDGSYRLLSQIQVKPAALDGIRWYFMMYE